MRLSSIWKELYILMDPIPSVSCRESGTGDEPLVKASWGPPPGNNTVDFLPSCIPSTPYQLFPPPVFSQRDIEGKLTLVSHPLLSTVKNNA
jgi:hypothetical protein